MGRSLVARASLMDQPSQSSMDCCRVTSGTVVSGRYRIRELLREGGMGRVYAAEHLTLGMPLAVKILSPRIFEKPGARRRFLAEAQIASQLTHNHIVRVFDFGEMEHGEPYIAMELLEGEDLQDRLDRVQRLSWSQLGRFALELCDALAFAHRRGTLHCDVKPSNCFLATTDGKERLVVLDFGLAKARTTASLALGDAPHHMASLAYASPEQLETGQPVAPSDVYSTAVLLYQCLTGESPYRYASSTTLRAEVVSGARPTAAELCRRADISPELAAVIVGNLALDPTQRCPDANALRTALLPHVVGPRFRDGGVGLDDRGSHKPGASPMLVTATSVVPDEDDEEADATRARSVTWVPPLVGLVIIFVICVAIRIEDSSEKHHEHGQLTARIARGAPSVAAQHTSRKKPAVESRVQPPPQIRQERLVSSGEQEAPSVVRPMARGQINLEGLEEHGVDHGSSGVGATAHATTPKPEASRPTTEAVVRPSRTRQPPRQSRSQVFAEAVQDIARRCEIWYSEDDQGVDIHFEIEFGSQGRVLRIRRILPLQVSAMTQCVHEQLRSIKLPPGAMKPYWMPYTTRFDSNRRDMR